MWPPYEGAGQGYWARQAGFSLPFQQQQQTYQPAQTMEQIQNTLQQQQLYTPQMVSGQTYWVPRQQQQQLYTEQQQQQLPAVAYTQAVELTSDQLRAQQIALMQKYLTSNEVLTTSTVHPKLLAGAGQNLYRCLLISPFFHRPCYVNPFFLITLSQLSDKFLLIPTHSSIWIAQVQYR